MNGYQRIADKLIDHAEQRPPRPQYRREPLTATQHILHLLLTLVTVGLWAPVWIVRAIGGNKRPDR